MNNVQLTGEGTRPLNNTRSTPVTLHSWYVYSSDADDVRFAGFVTDHPRQPRPGVREFVVATYVTEMPAHWPLVQGDIFRTLNTWYVLGEPSTLHPH